jgi:hypothetical protein
MWQKMRLHSLEVWVLCGRMKLSANLAFSPRELQEHPENDNHEQSIEKCNSHLQ